MFEKAFHRGDRPEAVFAAMLDGYLMSLYVGNGTDKAQAEAIVGPDNRHIRLQPLVDEAIDRYRVEVAQDQPFVDLLGPLYMELSNRFKQAGMGQYFTPSPLASMLAMMTAPEQLEAGRIYRICDPACGSGVMMLAMLQHVLRTHGREALRWWSVSGIDLDPLCARMFAVQLSENILAHRLELGEVHVLQGNSLGDHAKLKTVLSMTSTRLAQQHLAEEGSQVSSLVQPERQKQALIDPADQVAI